jgi:hypothetical protein
MAKKKSVTTGSRDPSDNRPMTIGEIATAVAKKKARGATKRRVVKAVAKKTGKQLKSAQPTAKLVEGKLIT